MELFYEDGRDQPHNELTAKKENSVVGEGSTCIYEEVDNFLEASISMNNNVAYTATKRGLSK